MLYLTFLFLSSRKKAVYDRRAEARYTIVYFCVCLNFPLSQRLLKTEFAQQKDLPVPLRPAQNALAEQTWLWGPWRRTVPENLCLGGGWDQQAREQRGTQVQAFREGRDRQTAAFPWLWSEIGGCSYLFALLGQIPWICRWVRDSPVTRFGVPVSIMRAFRGRSFALETSRCHCPLCCSMCHTYLGPASLVLWSDVPLVSLGYCSIESASPLFSDWLFALSSPRTPGGQEKPDIML